MLCFLGDRNGGEIEKLYEWPISFDLTQLLSSLANDARVPILSFSVSSAALDLVEWIFTRFGEFPTISHTQTLNPQTPPANRCISRNEQSRNFKKKCEVGDNFKGRDEWMIFNCVCSRSTDLLFLLQRSKFCERESGFFTVCCGLWYNISAFHIWDTHHTCLARNFLKRATSICFFLLPSLEKILWKIILKVKYLQSVFTISLQ